MVPLAHDSVPPTRTRKAVRLKRAMLKPPRQGPTRPGAQCSSALRRPDRWRIALLKVSWRSSWFWTPPQECPALWGATLHRLRHESIADPFRGAFPHVSAAEGAIAGENRLSTSWSWGPTCALASDPLRRSKSTRRRRSGSRGRKTVPNIPIPVTPGGDPWSRPGKINAAYLRGPSPRSTPWRTSPASIDHCGGELSPLSP